MASFPSAAQWSESFQNGWNNGNGWQGDVNAFTVENEMLRSDNIVLNHSFYITRPLVLKDDLEWRLTVNLRFNTSSVNYTDIVLWSDSVNPGNSGNCYFLRIGNTKDELAFYRIRNNGAPELLMDGRDNLTAGSNNFIYLKINLETGGKWIINSKSDPATNWYLEGSAKDSIAQKAGYFGILIKQSTASFFKKHYFDDIYIGEAIRDTAGPILNSYELHSDSQISLSFDEPIRLPSSLDSCFQWSGGVVNRMADITGAQVVLSLQPGFTKLSNYQLRLTAISDTSGNRMMDTIVQFKFALPDYPNASNLMITEMMVDPDPVVQLPPAEFIELYNPSHSPVFLKGVVLRDPTSSAILPDFVLQPFSHVILCSPEQVSDFEFFGNALGIQGLPSLNNSGDSIFLLNDKGEIIDQVFYVSNWYRETDKSSGGYSLELIDTGWHCEQELNWKASADPSGGTPGRYNSVKGRIMDTLAPAVLALYSISAREVSWQLSEMPSNGPNALGLTSDLLNFKPAKIEFMDQGVTLMVITPEVTFEANKPYKFAIQGLKDCSGNVSDLRELSFMLPDSAAEGDLVINEVLFNPPPNGSDFIELLNISEKSLDLSTLYLANRDDNGVIKSKSRISQLPLLFYPGDYILFSRDPEFVKSQFPKKDAQVFVQVPDIPALPDEKGNLLIITDTDEIIDFMEYDESMHHPLIQNTEGVSLEKIYPEKSGALTKNWHTAASSAGYGTPGLPNSQLRYESKPDQVLIDQPVFSPDGDGYMDMLMIGIKSEFEGSAMNVVILDVMGRTIKELAKGIILGSENLLYWNGTDDKNSPCAVGAYLVYVEIFDKEAEIRRYKFPVTLAARLKD